MSAKVKKVNPIRTLFKKLGENIASLFQKIKLAYYDSVVEKVLKAIGAFIGLAFWPFKWIKKRTFDRLRFDVQKRIVSLIFLLPVIIGFLIFFAYPLITSFQYSFCTVTVGPNGVVPIFAKFYTHANDAINGLPAIEGTNMFYNYKFAFTMNADFPVELLNSLGTVASDCAVITIFSLLIAVMLNGNFKGRGFVRAIFFLPVIFNSQALTAANESISTMTTAMSSAGKNALTTLFDISVFMQGLGVPVKLVTFLSGITDAIYDTISYSGIQILIFLTAIQSVPKHLYEAAKMEGATGYEMFWKITLPMVSSMIPTVIVYTVIDSYLRLPINKVIEVYSEQSEYGIHAAMSWIYLGVVGLFLAIVLFILSKVVFYYDDRK